MFVDLHLASSASAVVCVSFAPRRSALHKSGARSKKKKKSKRARNKKWHAWGEGQQEKLAFFRRWGKNSHASRWTGHLNSAMLHLSVPEIREANNF